MTSSKKKKHFTLKIDFYEYSFLLEACIPPRPIARSMFWIASIDEHYHQMSPEERSILFKWLITNPLFEDRFEKGNEDVVAWYNRYNPDNQFRVSTNFRGIRSEFEAFLHNGKYHRSMSGHLTPEFITHIEQIHYEKS